jgi:isopentenyldiphosphate isomerase
MEQNKPEFWQLYDNQGQALIGQGADKPSIRKGLLHGASHIWIWRQSNNSVEILLQKRAANKHTWPNLLDISAAGHIDLGEIPLDAALRETKEEIGININASDLRLINVFRDYITVSADMIENEFQWIYLYRLADDFKFKIQGSEVDSLIWIKLSDFQKDVQTKKPDYVPHGDNYFNIVISAIKAESNALNS